LELSRYVVLNPVRAGMVETAGDWAWSSYRGVMGKAAAPEWLAVHPTLELFHPQRGPARQAFARFVADGVNADGPYKNSLKAGFLGNESFIETLLEKHDPASVSSEIPKRLRPARSLEQIARQSVDRDQAIAVAYRSGAYTLTEIARHFGIHLSTASRIARRQEDARNKT
jgi:hypothetical protein